MLLSHKGLEVQVHHVISLGGWNDAISVCHKTSGRSYAFYDLVHVNRTLTATCVAYPTMSGVLSCQRGTAVIPSSCNNHVMVTGETRVVTGQTRVVTGETRVVTGEPRSRTTGAISMTCRVCSADSAHVVVMGICDIVR
jgi:hypothetical protein